MYRSSQHKAGKSSLLSSYVETYGDAVHHHRATIAEKALRVEAEGRDRAKSQFIANMSHELRTPLNAIIGFSQIMREGDQMGVTPEKVVEYSGYINDTAQHLLSIINNLLDMSKIQSGHQELFLGDIDPSELIRVCLNLINGAAGDRNVKLVNKAPDNLPVFQADAVRLKQVFSNILSNAVKCTPEGGEVHILAEQDNEGSIVFSFVDTGRGMTQQEIETAKRPFRQVDNGLDRTLNGTGLGIPIALGIVELHGGEMEIHSQKGIGTTVTVQLPLQQGNTS